MVLKINFRRFLFLIIYTISLFFFICSLLILINKLPIFPQKYLILTTRVFISITFLLIGIFIITKKIGSFNENLFIFRSKKIGLLKQHDTYICVFTNTFFELPSAHNLNRTIYIYSFFSKIKIRFSKKRGEKNTENTNKILWRYENFLGKSYDNTNITKKIQETIFSTFNQKFLENYIFSLSFSSIISIELS